MGSACGAVRAHTVDLDVDAAAELHEGVVQRHDHHQLARPLQLLGRYGQPAAWGVGPNIPCARVPGVHQAPSDRPTITRK
jgi:hypothetical protein